MEDYDKDKKSPYLQYWDANKLYGWAISQKFPVNNFEWIEDTSQLQCRKWWRLFSWSWCSMSWKNYINLIDSSYLPERMKTEKVEKLVANWHDKT